MAVRVEERRRRRFPWWLLAIVALALIALLVGVLFAAFDTDEDEGAGQRGGAAVTGQDGGGAVLDLEAITSAGDERSLVGRRVELTGVQVQSVVGDKTFWIGPRENEEVFVVLDEEQDPAGVEGAVDVDAGQTVSLTGTIRQVPDSPQEEFDLSQENTADVSEETIYIAAERVERTT